MSTSINQSTRCSINQNAAKSAAEWVTGWINNTSAWWMEISRRRCKSLPDWPDWKTWLTDWRSLSASVSHAKSLRRFEPQWAKHPVECRERALPIFESWLPQMSTFVPMAIWKKNPNPSPDFNPEMLLISIHSGVDWIQESKQTNPLHRIIEMKVKLDRETLQGSFNYSSPFFRNSSCFSSSSRYQRCIWQHLNHWLRFVMDLTGMVPDPSEGRNRPSLILRGLASSQRRLNDAN